MRRRRTIILASVCGAWLLAGGNAMSWSSYGGDPGGTRYAPLAQIDRGNVGELEVAWSYRTGESGEGFASQGKMAFEVTPILAQGRLYLSTPLSTVIALDPATGEELWRHDPGIDRTRRYAEATSRGVSSWQDADAAPDAPCAHRIFLGTLDGRLIALDGSTGRSCADFGEGGTVDLTVDVRLTDPGQYTITSPPAIAGDLVITGSAIGDNRAVDLELGIVQAFDARSGGGSGSGTLSRAIRPIRHMLTGSPSRRR